MTRAALYARYSSDSQRDASIKDQLRLCRAHAERKGWSVTLCYTDRAMSGASLLHPGIQELMQDAQRGGFELVPSEALDRVSRDQEDVACRDVAITRALGLAERPRSSPRLDPDQSSLKGMVHGQPDYERNADIPHGQAGGKYSGKPLALILAEIAGAERELSTGKEQNHAEHFLRNHLEDDRYGRAHEQRQEEEQTAEHDWRSAGTGTECDVACHAAGAMAHGDATDQRASEVHDTGRERNLAL